MHRLTRHVLFTRAVLICVLALMLSAAAARELPTSAQPTTLHFQATSTPTNNTTVTNVLTVRSTSISLGSTLEAQGSARIGTQPLPNAQVALHMGDVVVATTQTDATGAYTFSAPVGVYYFPAAVSGAATVYSVVTPPGGTSTSAPSGVTNVTVDVLPLYALIIIVVGVVLLGLYAYTRRLRGKAARPARAKPQPPAQESAGPAETAPPPELSSPSPPSEREHGVAIPTDQRSQPAPQPEHEGPTAEPESRPSTPSTSPEEHATAEAPPSDLAASPPERAAERPAAVSRVGTDNATLIHARELFGQGKDCQAINALYDDAITALVNAGDISLAPHMTYWERYDAIETAMPEVRVPLRRLTLSYELCHYRDKPLAKEDQDAALEAFRSIMEHVEKRTRAQ
ncbi:MAG: hypothetical protein ACXV3D_08660 [Halobacteriota archaeon]